MRPVIVHLSNDYPDPLFPDKTRAIRELVEGTAEDFEHIVYSLNRKNGWSGISASPFGKNNVVVTYKALPKGILWGKRLGDVATWIEADLRAKNIIPDLIEAHKFTVEGLIGQQLARVFKKPLICDIQGDTDTNILKKKIGLRSRYQEIAREAKDCFFLLRRGRWKSLNKPFSLTPRNVFYCLSCRASIRLSLRLSLTGTVF